jgi:hypothetical protein
MPFTCLGLGYDVRIYKGLPASSTQPAQMDEHPVLSSIALIIIALLEILN